jgi:hypothetical protein
LDTYEGSEQLRLAGADCLGLERQIREKLERHVPRADFFRSPIHQALKMFFRDFVFNFIYVDGDKDPMNVLRSSVFSFDLLAPGGCMIWSDYEWDLMADAIDRPKLAIESFLSCYASRVEVIGLGTGEGAQVAVRKLA